MMMFHADTAFAVQLIALVAGTFLLLWVSKQEAGSRGFGKIVAYFTIVASVLAMLCTTYYTIRYKKDGFMNGPHPMMQGMNMNDCPMMPGQDK